MNRRRFLQLTGTTLGASTVVGTADASHVEDPYADEYIPAAPSNYTDASRGRDTINWIVVHGTEGSYGSAIATFQNPDSNVSAHYVMRNADGHAAQMVHHEDIAYHAGGTNYNDHSIGIEHGAVVVGESTFTDTLYERSAQIVRSLADRYDIPLERPAGVAPCDATTDGGIIGHRQVPETDCGYNDHTDPGATWDWDHYMALLGGTNHGSPTGTGGDDTEADWPSYGVGDESESVFTIQYLLADHGYHLAHDGIYGPETKTTIEKFQTEHNLVVDGIVGPNTWNVLFVPVFGPNRDPYWATYGAQHQLRFGHGYSIAVDGYYGPETEAAIREFQRRANIAVDGIVGHDTWQELVAIG